MSQVIIQSIDFHQTIVQQKIHHLSTRNKSPQHQKQNLIKKIEILLHENNKLQIKKESLQNTIFDLRKLIQLTRKQGDQDIQHIRQSNEELNERKETAKAALKYSQRDGNHLQKCMLYWNEFL